MRAKNLCVLLCLLVAGSTGLFAQNNWFVRDQETQVWKGTTKTQFPWAGGLNAVQYGTLDLDRDGTDDLIVFDRTTSKVSTFLADPKTKSYRYHPEFEALFPPMTNWMVLADFDHDGKKELFTYVAQGVTVYRQEESQSGWHWRQLKNYLTTTGLSGRIVNLEVAPSDIPAIVDLDQDGDLDIITFESGGDYLELNQNLSMEKYGVPDSLEFVRKGDCWGDFRKHTCGDFVFGIDCGVPANTKPSDARVMHAGNSVLLHDLNGDGKLDMLMGNVECENLSVLFNSTTGLAARFKTYQPTYPNADPAVMPMFPAAYLEDVDFDGIKDLLVSPNVYGNDDFRTDFVHSGWYYHNAGTNSNPDFKLRQKDFLQREMIDVGENAAVSLFDIDGDGDLDLLIGNRGFYDDEQLKGTLSLYSNTGTPGKAKFTFESSDYFELSRILGHTNLQPQWLDFNGDGKIDLGIASVFNRKLYYHYFPGQDTGAYRMDESKKVSITLPPELTVSDRLFFHDADHDGDPDLLVGGVLGNLSYYENTGNNSAAVFQLRDQAFGGVGNSFSGRFLSIAAGDIDLDGNDELILTDRNGKLRILYNGLWGQWTKTDTSVIASLPENLPVSPVLGNGIHLALGDLNGDGKPDLVTGTTAGGVNLFMNKVPVTVTGTEPQATFIVYPNPTQNEFKIESGQGGTAEIIDLAGKRILEVQLTAGLPVTIRTTGWSKGIYVIRLTGEGPVIIRKLVIQ